MKKIFIGLTCFLLTSTMLLGYLYKSSINSPFVKNNNDVVELNASKTTVSGVINENKDTFSNTLFLKIYNKINNISVTVKKGSYSLPKDTTYPELISYLQEGKYNNSIKKVTIPEGSNIEQIGEILEKNKIITKDKFIAECNNYNFPSYVKTNKNIRYPLEGYLFPDTYIFLEGAPGKDIIQVMLKRFEQILEEIEKENNITIKKEELHKYITKASLIEEEVSLKEEKPLVSSVINNRLNKKIKLQIDATVLYAHGKHINKLLYKDLEIASPYNTYYVSTLPIGPISNPGKDSILAAYMPEKTNYLFYMTKNGNKHKFFSNYEDFLAYKKS